MSIEEVVLAEPRGFCAGVDRAIEIVERALDDLDGAIDAGTKAARLGENNLFDAHRDTVGRAPGRPKPGRTPSGGSERSERGGLMTTGLRSVRLRRSPRGRAWG